MKSQLVILKFHQIKNFANKSCQVWFKPEFTIQYLITLIAQEAPIWKKYIFPTLILINLSRGGKKSSRVNKWTRKFSLKLVRIRLYSFCYNLVVVKYNFKLWPESMIGCRFILLRQLWLNHWQQWNDVQIMWI